MAGSHQVTRGQHIVWLEATLNQLASEERQVVWCRNPKRIGRNPSVGFPKPDLSQVLKHGSNIGVCLYAVGVGFKGNQKHHHLLGPMLTHTNCFSSPCIPLKEAWQGRRVRPHLRATKLARVKSEVPMVPQWSCSILAIPKYRLIILAHAQCPFYRFVR